MSDSTQICGSECKNISAFVNGQYIQVKGHYKYF